MSVPVLVVTGFLGAGKTTFINGLLQGDHGLRIAAIVNDFGAIDIDAALIGPSAEGVVGLKNGCICCSLQGDLLRTLKLVLRSPCDLIVIEASGVADPAGIVQSLVDPVIWAQARLQTVACVVDATDAKARAGDPLWQAQVRGSDLLVLAKAGLVPEDALAATRLRLGTEWGRPVLDPDEALLQRVLMDPPARAPAGQAAPPLTDDRFAHLEWEHDGAVSLPAFQRVMEGLAPTLVRAKGFLQARNRPDMLLFQLSGRRATLERAPKGVPPGCRVVLIGEREAFDAQTARAALRALEG
jgi:G3E family GTPase